MLTARHIKTFLTMWPKALFFELVRCLAVKINVRIYNFRAQILQSSFSSYALPSGIVHIDCASNVVAAATNVPRSHPSVTETRQCTSSHCPGPMRVNSIVIMPVSAEVIQKCGVRAISEAAEKALLENAVKRAACGQRMMGDVSDLASESWYLLITGRYLLAR